MKLVLTILLLWGLSVSAAEHNWYRIYLNGEVAKQRVFPVCFNNNSSAVLHTKPSWAIPPFERPKGAIFCRMEDYLTSKTKVWIKVGVK